MSVHRGLLILLAIGITLLLGLIGSYQLDPQGFAERPGDYLYRIVQLFAIEGDWTSGQEHLPLALEIARFIAPFVTIASLIALFAENIWTALVNARVRLYKQHVVVVGLSASSMVLIRSCKRRNLDVVVIEKDLNNIHVVTCRSLFVPVLIGDAKQADLLRRARTHLARCLISFIDVDDDNVELSLRIQDVVEVSRDADAAPLKVVLQIADMQLGNRLESYPKFFEYPQRLEVSFLNLDEQAARSLFIDAFPEVYADALGRPAVHIAIFGYAGIGRHVLLGALKQAQFANAEPLRVTVIDPDASDAQAIFERQCPEIGLTAEVQFIDADIDAESVRAGLLDLDLDEVTMFVVCKDSDADNMSLALALRQMGLLALLPNAPIFLALRYSQGLAQLVESGQGNPEIPDGLYPFAMVEQLLRVDRVINEHIDEIAVALHEKYLGELKKQEYYQTSHRPWGLLPEMFRNHNRAQADHLNIKLRAAGYALVRGNTDFTFSEIEVERLAEMEKKRWVAERATLGWTYAPERSDIAKVHPGLKSWSASTEQERAPDKASVREIPNILRHRLGLGIQKQITIGITGHRAHRIAHHRDYVEHAVQEQLEQIAQQHPDARFGVLSALADGSDRLVADMAVKRLNAQLFVALPLPYEIYKHSFGHEALGTNKSSNEEFQRFVGRAALYFEMPLRFGGAQLLEQDDAAGELARSHQYALAGAYIASRADELIAIWDGQDARGTGGTAEVVSWREQGFVPEKYSFAGHYFAPVKMTPPRVVSLPVDGTEDELANLSAG